MATDDENPYGAPTAAVADRVEPAKQGLRCGRIATTIVALNVTSLVLAVAGGLVLKAHPDWFGGSWASKEAAAIAADNWLLAIRLLIALAYVPIYYLMLRPLASRRVAHALLVIAGIALLDHAVGMATSKNMLLSPDLWSHLFFAIAPVIVLAWLWVRRRRHGEDAPRLAVATDEPRFP